MEPGSQVSRRWVEWRRRIDLESYDRRWDELASRGQSIHGEVDFVDRCAMGRRLRILDAGCGTGRVAIEAERRGHTAVGVDLDPDMIERARIKAPHIEWHLADLSRLDLGTRFDVAIMAGNIPLFCEPGTQSRIVSTLEQHLLPGGLLICGFSIETNSGAYTPSMFVDDVSSSNFVEIQCFATWDGDPSASDGSDDYALFVCRTAAVTNPSSDGQ